MLKFINNYFLLMLGLIFVNSCHTSSRINLNKYLYNFSRDCWISDECGLECRVAIIEHLQSYQEKESLNEKDILSFLGSPVHRRNLISGMEVFVYRISEDVVKCGYGELFCLLFSKTGHLHSCYLCFISEDVDHTKFWHSENVDKESRQNGENDNRFYRSIPYRDL